MVYRGAKNPPVAIVAALSCALIVAGCESSGSSRLVVLANDGPYPAAVLEGTLGHHEADGADCWTITDEAGAAHLLLLPEGARAEGGDLFLRAEGERLAAGSSVTLGGGEWVVPGEIDNAAGCTFDAMWMTSP